jgi:hypothetical protein
MKNLLTIIYDELGLFMLLFSIMMVPFLTITGACILAYAALHWWPW